MASSQPIVKQVKLISLIPQLMVMGLIILVYYLADTEYPVLFGALTYLLISVVVRQAIPRYHRKGIRLFKNSQYENAIIEFQKSYDFFRKYKWIDDYRYVVLLSSSRISYLEMSLINMAYCYGQLGQGSRSKEIYEKALAEFPDSQMAISALKMFDAAKDIK